MFSYYLQFSFRHSVSQSPVTRKSSPATEKMRRMKSFLPRFPQAPPCPVQGPPTASRSRTAWPRAPTRWMPQTPPPGAPPTGAWQKSAGLSRHCKVRSLPKECGVACLCSGWFAHWSGVFTVCPTFSLNKGCEELASQFLSQEIDGQALMLLREDHLISTMNIKLGPALKICASINSLRDWGLCCSDAISMTGADRRGSGVDMESHNWGLNQGFRLQWVVAGWWSNHNSGPWLTQKTYTDGSALWLSLWGVWKEKV